MPPQTAEENQMKGTVAGTALAHWIIKYVIIIDDYAFIKSQKTNNR